MNFKFYKKVPLAIITIGNTINPNKMFIKLNHVLAVVIFENK
jgi:hypothetical protein